MSQGEKLTLTSHLKEFRSRLLKAVIAVCVAIPISFFLTFKFFDILMRPVPGIELIYTEITEMIGTYVKVGLLGAIVMALPAILYHMVKFIHPALTKKEKNYLYFMLPLVIVFFIAGASFSYFLLLPPALNFLLGFGSGVATPMIKVANYISVVCKLLFWIGICFEIPIITFFLTKIGVVTPEKLAKYRRWAIIGAFVLGAIITPTIDPINQSIVAGSIIVLYEVGILLSKLARRKAIELTPAESGGTI